jgi:transcriptional regulator GlxA family with amidase domain
MRRRLASRIGFENAAVALAMNSLRTELSRNDDLSNLYLEAWAIQALVLLHRSSVQLPPHAKTLLSKIQISNIIEFMEANVGNDITLDSLAKFVDVSPRHLRRLFLAATGSRRARCSQIFALNGLPST